jgi:acetate kinase
MQRGEVSNVQASGSKVEVWVVPTDEGKVAAQEAADKLGLH